VRLTEERIEFINHQVLRALIEAGFIEVAGRESAVLVEMNRTVMQDLALEDRIDAEVREMIGKMKRQIPEGSAEWNSVFLKKKDELAARYNYVL
jgi:hypothetical protein